MEEKRKSDIAIEQIIECSKFLARVRDFEPTVLEGVADVLIDIVSSRTDTPKSVIYDRMSTFDKFYKIGH